MRTRGRRKLEEIGEEPDARFSFANERTFLAWNRTALALIAAGLAIVQLLPRVDFPGGRRLLGLPFIVLGAVVAFTSYGRWRANEVALRMRRPLPASNLPRLLTYGIAFSAVVAFVIAAVAERR